MYNKTYEYYVNPTKRLFCSDDEGTPISDLPRFYFGERPVFTMTFPDNVLTEGEKLVFVMDNENRFLDSHSTTGLAPVMAWCVHEITADDVQNESIDLELYCFGKKYADVINGHDNAVPCILSLFIKSIDENLNCTFSTLATTLAYAEPTIVSPDCVFDELPIDMYLTRDEMNALIAEVEAIQREAIEKAEQARQSAAVAEAAAQEAGQIAKDLKPLQLSSPPTTSTSGSVGQLAVWHDAEANKDHLYHLCFVSEGESATLYHWEECVLVSMGNVAGGYPVLNTQAKIPPAQLPIATFNSLGVMYPSSAGGINITVNGLLSVFISTNADIDARRYSRPIVGTNLNYAVRSVLPNVTEIPAATSDYSLVDSSATTNNHSHVYSHAPTTVPTYRLPQVTNTTISHYIELTVDFANVQTYSFLDYQGEPIVPLFTPSIAAGDVYTFKMEYSAIKAAWLIYPQKQGAVADDFVMRGEVGAANGVAGLDVNAKVPRGQLPIASSTERGTIKVMPRTYSGLGVQNTDELYIVYANNSDISGRTAQRNPIVPFNLNTAVTAALTDANHITLTDAQKATAQGVFGVGGPITAIPAATSAYTLAGGIFTHAPTSAPTYTLPNITDDIRTHKVVLIIDFSSVQTFSFLVDGGGDVTFQSYANPTTGDVWAFRCWWYGGKWRIAPTKIKNCVTRQLVNGSLAITDAVAGNALALKMTAPRSVVVNQHINATDTSVTLTSGRTWLTYIGGVGEKVTGEGQSVACTGGTDMAVDLTQYFNGNQTLIDSITSWDDLVAYDPRFAQYVEYNTGTVTGVQPQVKVTGKNLQPKATEARTVAGVTFTPNEDGSITVSGTPTTEATYSTPNCYFKQGSILTASGISEATNIIWSAILLYDKDGNSLYNSGGSISSKITVDTSLYPTAAYMVLRFKRSANNVPVSGKIYPQIELGSVATAYEPYHDGGTAQAPAPLFAVGNAADEFEAVSGVTTRKISSYTFTGEENWITYSEDRVIWKCSLTGKAFGQTNQMMADYVTSGPPLLSIADKSIIASSSTNVIYVRDTSYVTAADFKAHMVGKTIYYVLATPTTSPSTPTQISLQAGSNTAMQTDGGRLAPIDITYESDEL